MAAPAAALRILLCRDHTVHSLLWPVTKGKSCPKAGPFLPDGTALLDSPSAWLIPSQNWTSPKSLLPRAPSSPLSFMGQTCTAA